MSLIDSFHISLEYGSDLLLYNRLFSSSFFERVNRQYFRRNKSISDWALDTRVPLLSNKYLKPIVMDLAKILVEFNLTQIVGRGFGAFPLVGGLTFYTDSIVSGLVRDTAKEYGFRELVEGSLSRDVPICIVDDLISTGTSSGKLCRDLRKLGYTVTNVLSVFRYSWLNGKNFLQSLGLDVKSISVISRSNK